MLSPQCCVAGCERPAEFGDLCLKCASVFLNDTEQPETVEDKVRTDLMTEAAND